MVERVDHLVRKLKEWDSREPNLNLSSSMLKMSIEFKRVQSFLDRAERKRENDKIIESWVSKVMSLVQEVEDVVDMLNLNFSNKTASFYDKIRDLVSSDPRNTVAGNIRRFLSKHHQRKASTADRSPYSPLIQSDEDTNLGELQSVADGIIGFTECLFDMDNTKLLEQFSKEVTDDLKQLRRELPEKKLDQATTSMTSHSENACQTLLELTDLIGRQDQVSELQTKLLRKEEPNHLIAIGVIGESGSGKTALATEVYQGAKPHFTCYTWVVASQNSTSGLLQDVLRGFLKSQLMRVPSNIDASDEASLKEMIRRCLYEKKFLLVLDDVSSHQWECIKDAFPHGCGGKVLLTSRASKFQKPKPFLIKLKGLKPDDAKKLLYKRAFSGRQVTKSFRSHWKSAALEILKICDGNPLTIGTVGGMLSMKDMENSEWTTVSQSLQQVDFITLCYADLQPVLKSCFLYTSLFPPHRKIPCKKLQRLWIAEGLVQEKHANMTKEGAAKFQMNELIQRNMLQVVRLGKDGEPKYCKLLRPMREFSLKRSEQYQVCAISMNKGNLSVDRTLRLALQAGRSNSSEINPKNTNLSGLHSFLVFDEGKQQSLFTKSNWLSKFKLLSVLDLQDAPIETLPGSIGNLGLLNYLGLRGTKLVELPTSIKKLQRMEILDVRDTSIRSLPPGLENSKKLRHLLLANSFGEKVVNVMVDVEVFQNLQKIAGVKFTEEIGKGLMTLLQLQKLSVGKVKSCHSEQLGKSIDQMKLLESLTIKCDLGEQIQVELRNHPENLEKLRIGGHVKDLLGWVSQLKSLKLLYVWDCTLTSDPFAALQHLPNLVLLSICNAYVGENIQFEAKGFPNLKKISILHCMKLSRWSEITKGAMPNLEKLTIGYCPKLITLPDGLGDLNYLRALQVTSMPKQFVENARKLHWEQKSKFSLLVQGLPYVNSPEEFSKSHHSSEAKSKDSTLPPSESNDESYIDSDMSVGCTYI